MAGSPVYVIYFVTLPLLSHAGPVLGVTTPTTRPGPVPTTQAAFPLALLVYRHTSATKRRGACGPKSSVRRRGCTPLRRGCVPQHRCARGSIAARQKKCYQRAWKTHGAAPQEAAPPAARRAASSAALARETSTKAAGLRRAVRHRDDDHVSHGRAAVSFTDAQQPQSDATERPVHAHLVECAAARRPLWIEF